MSYSVPNIQAAQGVHAQSGASPAMPLYSKISSLYSRIDTSGTGSISQSQFEQAFVSNNPPARFQAQGADAIWSQLSNSSTGSVSKQDFIQGMAKLSVVLKNTGSGPSNVQSTAQTIGNSLSALSNLGSLDLSA